LFQGTYQKSPSWARWNQVIYNLNFFNLWDSKLRLVIQIVSSVSYSD
jgi:hypothetical protein